MGKKFSVTYDRCPYCDQIRRRGTYREWYDKRNKRIENAHRAGMKTPELAEKFKLSILTIRSVIYKDRRIEREKRKAQNE